MIMDSTLSKERKKCGSHQFLGFISLEEVEKEGAVPKIVEWGLGRMGHLSGSVTFSLET